MKTNRIILILGLAVFGVLAYSHSPVKKSAPCCPNDGTASAVMTGSPATAANSVYQLKGYWTDQNERKLGLSKLGGRPQIVAMIFTHCTSICPRIVEEMKSIRDSLPAAIKNQVGGVLVSFDPDRDTPVQLRQFAAAHQLDNQWELLQGNASQVRELSMVLNVKYQRLSGGDYSHSGNIYILDRTGNLVQAIDGLGRNVHQADEVLARLVGR